MTLPDSRNRLLALLYDRPQQSKEAGPDMAYNSTENLQAVADLGETLYSPFKKNATGGIGGIFEKAFHFFCLKREEFLPHYHKRSNVESTISMIKRKFGDAVRVLPGFGHV